MQQRRRYIRLEGPGGAALKMVIKNAALRALAGRIRIRDISIGGISMTVPGAENVVFAGMPLELTILPPKEELCWLTGSVVRVEGDICRVRFEEDFYEQKKLSRYVLQREREISGYLDWGSAQEEAGGLGEDILNGIWRDQKQKPERKKILVLSTAGGAFAFLEDRYDLMTVADVSEARQFGAGLLLVDTNNLIPGFSSVAKDPGHPLMEPPVHVFVEGRREINFITIRTRRPEDQISYSMSADRFRAEFPEIIAALFIRDRGAEEAGEKDKF